MLKYMLLKQKLYVRTVLTESNAKQKSGKKRNVDGK